MIHGAKPLYGQSRIMGSNPILSAKDFNSLATVLPRGFLRISGLTMAVSGNGRGKQSAQARY
jgi:hypothetical protein